MDQIVNTLKLNVKRFNLEDVDAIFNYIEECEKINQEDFL